MFQRYKSYSMVHTVWMMLYEKYFQVITIDMPVWPNPKKLTTTILRDFLVIRRRLGSCCSSICSRSEMAIQKLANYGTR